jgi:hypothetical protein
MQDLRGVKLAQVQTDLDNRRAQDDADERKAIEQFNVQENFLKNNIFEYDKDMEMHKESIECLKKEDGENRLEMNKKKMEKDKVKQTYQVYQETYDKHQKKMEILSYENEVKVNASELIQAQFKGFWIRKTQTKKYKKILAPLKKVKVEVCPPPDKKGKPGKR